MQDEIQKIIENYFISIPLKRVNMIIYGVRNNILTAVKEVSPLFYGKILDIGCGYQPYKKIILSNEKVSEYIGLDLAKSNGYHGSVEPDLKWSGEKIPLENESINCIIATEFLEHYADTNLILEEMKRVLKTNGVLFLTVPFIWNLHEIPYDEYRFTPYSLQKHLSKVGFSDIDIKPLGGWNAAFSQFLSLWLTYSPINKYLRRFLSYLVFPLYVLLLKTDKKPVIFDDKENSMFSGLYVIARKK